MTACLIDSEYGRLYKGQTPLTLTHPLLTIGFDRCLNHCAIVNIYPADCCSFRAIHSRPKHIPHLISSRLGKLKHHNCPRPFKLARSTTFHSKLQLKLTKLKISAQKMAPVNVHTSSPPSPSTISRTFGKTKGRGSSEYPPRSSPHSKGYKRMNTPKEPQTPKFKDLGMGRHSQMWLFDMGGWKRLFGKDDHQHHHRSQSFSEGQ